MFERKVFRVGLSVMHSDDDNDAIWYIHKISYIDLIS